MRGSYLLSLLVILSFCGPTRGQDLSLKRISIFPEEYAGRKIVLKGVWIAGDIRKADGLFFLGISSQDESTSISAYLKSDSISFTITADLAKNIMSVIAADTKFLGEVTCTVARTKVGGQEYWLASVSRIAQYNQLRGVVRSFEAGQFQIPESQAPHLRVRSLVFASKLVGRVGVNDPLVLRLYRLATSGEGIKDKIPDIDNPTASGVMIWLNNKGFVEVVNETDKTISRIELEASFVSDSVRSVPFRAYPPNFLQLKPGESLWILCLSAQLDNAWEVFQRKGTSVETYFRANAALPSAEGATVTRIEFTDGSYWYKPKNSN